MSDTKKWYNIELKKDKANKLKEYLAAQGYKYEPSEADNLIHLEILLSKKEYDAVSEYIENKIF